MIDRMSGRVALLLVVVALILVFLLGWFVLVAPQNGESVEAHDPDRRDERAAASRDEPARGPDRSSESRVASGLEDRGARRPEGLPDSPSALGCSIVGRRRARLDSLPSRWFRPRAPRRCRSP